MQARETRKKTTKGAFCLQNFCEGVEVAHDSFFWRENLAVELADTSAVAMPPSLPRVFHAAKTALKVNSSIPLSESATHHVSSVLRLKAGEGLVLFTGQGGQFRCSLVDPGRKNNPALVRLEEFQAIDNESPLRIHLGQAVSRGKRMDFALQKAVELGATQITPLITEFCGVKLGEERWDKKQLHWNGIVVSACEQCQRNRIPIVHPASSIASWLPLTSSTHPSSVRLILDPQAKTSLAQLCDTRRGKERPLIYLATGSEGGFSPQELQLARSHGFQSVSLGPRVLRTETAAMVALTILQASLGDLS